MTPAQTSALLSLADAAVTDLVVAAFNPPYPLEASREQEDRAEELLRALVALTEQVGALPPQAASFLPDFDEIHKERVLNGLE